MVWSGIGLLFVSSGLVLVCYLSYQVRHPKCNIVMWYKNIQSGLSGMGPLRHLDEVGLVLLCCSFKKWSGLVLGCYLSCKVWYWSVIRLIMSVIEMRWVRYWSVIPFKQGLLFQNSGLFFFYWGH